MAIQAQIGYQTLQLAVLLAKLAQLPQFVQTKPRILPFPKIETLLTDAVLTADLHDCRTRLCLAQHTQNLLL